MLDDAREQREFLRRIKSGLGQIDEMADVATWLQKHTVLDGRLWAFKDHEYQRDIANDACNRISVKKCSQVGLSELLVRKILAFLNTHQNMTAIYTLPSSSFARKFVKGRIDPVISASKIISENLNLNVDSTEMKQFKSCFLYIAGTYGQQSAISIPADMVVQDEVDFCDQKVLTTFSSRLRHAKEGGYLWRFSTPTVDGYGISESYDKSDKKLYFCKCKCGYEAAPKLSDFHIPGFDSSIDKFRKEDLFNEDYDFSKAVQRCPKCKRAWPLTDPGRRRWVAERPGIKHHSGYKVSPWDVPKYNTAASIFMQADTYETHMDWKNFVIGDSYNDSSNSFLMEQLQKNRVLSAILPNEDGSKVAEGLVMGVDVGKTSWIIIGVPKGGRGLEVVHIERVLLEGDGTNISDRVLFLAKVYGVRRAVIDAAPDFTTALRVVEGLPSGWGFACYYTRVDAKRLTDVSLKDYRVLHINRTKSLNQLSQDVEMGLIKFPRHPETKTLFAHLSSLKRVDQKAKGPDLVGKSFWINVGPDHYGHALNYCATAASTLTTGILVENISVLPNIGGVPYTSPNTTKDPNILNSRPGANLTKAEKYFLGHARGNR